MARIFQDSREKRIVGAKKAPWWVEWRENGRRRSQKVGARSKAKIVAAEKTTESHDRRNGRRIEKTWKDFRAEYERVILPQKRSRSVGTANREIQVLNAFERTMKPRHVTYVDAQYVSAFVTKRLKAPGKKKGDTMSPASIRSEIGTLRSILNVAVEWNCLAAVPKFPKVEKLGEDKPYVKAEHFDAIMSACGVATMPRKTIHPNLQCTPEGWWRGLLATIWVTGMRIGAVMAIRWADVDLDAGIVVSRARANKGKRDQRHVIRPAVELLRPLKGFVDPRLFPWNHNRRTLDVEFARIQREAGIHLDCPGEHEHTDACHLYGFHSFRYAHATYNFGRVSDRALQEQMGHASFETTKGYIKRAEREQQQTAYDAFLPGSLKPVVAG